MTDFSDTVRRTRLGDRFHYVWAAARSLALLDPSSRLQAMWIERSGGPAGAGDEVIDIAEGYGPERDELDSVLVQQLKYSSKHPDAVLGFSELGETLRKFAAVDARSSKAFPLPTDAPCRFVVVSNRPFKPGLVAAVRAIAADADHVGGRDVGSLRHWLGLPSAAAAGLCGRIEFLQVPLRVEELRSGLEVSVGGLSPDIDVGAASQLVEAVHRRASGELPTPIRADDVAVAFGTTVSALLPAPSQLIDPTGMLPRESVRELADQVLASPSTVVTAVGGSGKSVFAAQLPQLLAGRATVIVYDCFGNGGYRAPGQSRHRHRDGLVQIVSEMASRGLCAPLLPGPAASSEYVKAFRLRLQQAAAALTAITADARLVLVVDAADNAAMAGAERPGESSFANDLLRMAPVEAVHIVLTSRPERVDLLTAPPDQAVLPLPEFTPDESASLLRQQYPGASAAASIEFHRRTSGNPRVQALALRDSDSLAACLLSLSGFRGDAGDVLDQVFASRLDAILDAAGSERATLDQLGRLLATLRPRIPISVLVSLTGMTATAVRSFVSDLRRGLLIDEDAVQFLDEPTETYFRSRYAMTPEQAEQLATVLADLARSDAYAAASLPQLLWEAGRFEDLTSLALSDTALPESGELEHRQIQQLRLEFALRGAIERGKPVEIVELAMLAGSVAASTERRYELLSNEPDLAGDLLSSAVLDELHARRLLPSDWPGSHLGVEAVMLAVQPDRHGDASSRARAARQSLWAWVTRSDGSDRGPDGLKHQHLADAALALLLMNQQQDAARLLAGWEPFNWAFEPARKVAQVLLHRADVDRAIALAEASEALEVQVAVAAEMQRLGVPVTGPMAEQTWAALMAQEPLDAGRYADHELIDALHRGVAWVTAAAVRGGVTNSADAVALLGRYLPAQPPAGLGGQHSSPRTGLLLAFALRAQLASDELTADDLVPNPEGTGRQDPDDLRDRRAAVADVLPWVTGWAAWSLDRFDDVAAAALIASYPKQRSSYREPWLLRRVAGPLAALLARSTTSPVVVEEFRALLQSANAHSGMYVAMQMVAGLRGDDRFADAAYECAIAAAASVEVETVSADQRADDLVRIARALFAFDAREAREYFDRAVQIVSRVGNDSWQRWQAVLEVTRRVQPADQASGYRFAARLGRAAEALAPYLDGEVHDPRLVISMAQLAGPAALAVLGQWRDRGFGLDQQHLAVLIEDTELVRDRPELAIALTPLTLRSRVGGAVARLENAGELTGDRARAIQQLQWRLGRTVSAADVGEDVARKYGFPPEDDQQQRPRSPQAVWSPAPHDSDSDFEKKTAAQMAEVRERLEGLDLASPAAFREAHAVLAAGPYRADVSLLVARLAQQPVSARAAAVEAFWASGAFSLRQQAEFLTGVIGLPERSAALRRAAQDAAKSFLHDAASDLAVGLDFALTRTRLASLLGLSEPELLHQALQHADAASTIESSDRCYRLASTVASLLEPDAAAAAAASALGQLEAALELPSWDNSAVRLPQTLDLDQAVAGFLWTTLASPRAATRWQAAHAVRFLLEYQAEGVVAALGATAALGSVDGFVDDRFPFYKMHAVEMLLVAMERAAITDPRVVLPLVSTISVLRQQLPDHLLIARACQQIAARFAAAGLSADITDDGWGAPVRLQEVIFAPRHKRPVVPKPYGFGAIRSEFSLPYEFEENWVGELTQSFEVEHVEVMGLLDQIVLDEWGWRESAELEADPRGAAGALDREEAAPNRYEFPKAEDLQFYLAYHAMLVVAGRLAGARRPYQDRDDDQPDFSRWERSLGLSRSDRQWVADLRRPVPSHLGHAALDSGRTWLWEVAAADFEAVLQPSDRWITVSQRAQLDSSQRSDRVLVSSWLVDRTTGPALMRALQTAPSLNGPGIPTRDEEDEPVFAVGAFTVRDWLQLTYSEGGLDRRDEHAASVHSPPPGPAGWVQALMQLTVDDTALQWSQTVPETLALIADVWAEKDRGRNPAGPDGVRLRASVPFVERLLNETTTALLVEVRIDRNDESTRGYQRFNADDGLGYLDDYVRFFLYTPGEGWRDYRGSAVSRPTSS